jgi:hypothetical protein
MRELQVQIGAGWSIPGANSSKMQTTTSLPAQNRHFSPRLARIVGAGGSFFLGPIVLTVGFLSGIPLVLAAKLRLAEYGGSEHSKRPFSFL